MDILKAIALGVLQGLTEFLPVSSSGHLVIAQQLFPSGVSHAVAFDICLHIGTLLAVLVYFRHDLTAMARAVFLRRDDEDPYSSSMRRWVWLLALATVPVVLAGIGFADGLQRAFGSMRGVGAALLATAVLLVFASRHLQGTLGPEHVRASDALLIGLFQAFAIIPGISRSGATIAGGLSRGLRPATAARFAFLLSIPAIAAATLGSFAEVCMLLEEDAVAVAAGTAAAGVTGWLAIEVMMRAIRVGRLLPFALYCSVLGCAALVMGVA